VNGGLPAIDTAGGAGFGDDHLGEERELRLELPPNPGGDELTGGVLEARDVVEVAVVQFGPDRLEGTGDVSVIHEPAERGVARAGDGDLNLEAVAVEAAAFVGLRQARQQVGGLKLKGFAEFDVHKKAG